ncbi:MAG: NAD(P)H-dependent oxidoreductase subunit E [Gemmatimonadetes bacterium]|uniref:NAD(P)H-dependent oxidoreductase subunit E n=1 Tax=Candidatus Kutchimonas denitrificans TaxID=3056748 RepID=A0AAE5CC46_9BACT|nr:NAD(P)H-dependent oxidoreductase subunit E [Gemmatimonadota bacterium]NIR75210.1 NAD(P)H-dependent oxidoreductase subunit E [Candidatus Kutchimonas denitrificans]NIS00148.1 NAD(P)H-dependent oxidoreductase subunit E [Gemmatimonadota bacterium]NIT65740.1 NAD(P)H-dependent oxidoreductase subunit E [Gemmatimonadota bacterium]NIU53018.1 NADH-quinone oxidoreductase subunit NuoE [Gemmatimonadota bacterium]
MSDGLHPAVVSAQPSQRDEKNPDAPLFEGEYQDRLEKILSRYPFKRAALLPVLNMAQQVRGWISPDTIKRVAEILELSPAYVRSVASFYTMFQLRPAGKYLIQVCTGIGCDLCGAEDVVEGLLKATGTRIGETSADGKYTVVEVECLAGCGFPTMVQINDRMYENVKAEDVEGLLKELD